MTSDQSRELFSAAYDRELSEEQQREFDAALERDAEVKKEYEAFVTLLRRANTEAQVDEEAAPDLLPRFQAKLRMRSRGRFYRDRFSQKGGTSTLLPIILGVAMLLVIGIAWVALSAVEVGETPTEPAQR